MFHVLAHASETAELPASLYDPAYVEGVRRVVGPAEDRTLAEDALAIGRLLRTHRALAEAQLLAWLFADFDRASRVAARDLSVLAAEDVDRPELLPVLARQTEGVELLRCACELERPFFLLLPPEEVLWAELERALRRAVDVAPALAGVEVAVVPPLGLRGRVFGREIWIGASVDHGAWQAAHEATVLELGEASSNSGIDERDIERMAIVLLALRARRAGREAEHARWLSHFGSNAPPIELESLEPPMRAIVESHSGTSA